MPEHSDQHFVPNSYLKPWRDPETPSGQEPWVWRFSKNGDEARRKAPKNIFTETDIYTVTAADGSRDLTLEHGLSQLENDYCAIRAKLLAHEQLTSAEHLSLCVFTAAMKARSKAQRDHQGGQWGEVFEMMRSMNEQFKNSTPDQLDALSRMSAPPSGGPSLSFDDVKRIVEQPMGALLAPTISAVAPILHTMDMGLVSNSNPQGFITSDNPCIWYDPELVRMPPFYRHPSLMSPTIEVILPIAPSHMLLFNRRGFDSIFVAPDDVVQFYNRASRFHADVYFVTNCHTTKPFWFQQEELPDDAWERRHERREDVTP
jgi:hypothetical protein